MKMKIIDIIITGDRREIDPVTVSELAESIKMIGLINPITVDKNKHLIAGLHRFEAYRLLGLTAIEVVVIDCDSLRTELVEIDENLIRNNLDPISIGELALRRDEILEAMGLRANQSNKGRTGKYAVTGADSAPVKTTAEIAKKAGLSERSLQENKQLARDLVPEAKTTVREKAIPKVAALEISRLQPDEQRKVIAGNEKTDILAAARELRQQRTAERRAQRAHRRLETLQNQEQLDGALGTFSVIYADPPWTTDYSETSTSEAMNHYSVLTLEAICALNVQEIASNDAVLFLWTTSPKLKDAMQVLDAWGFEYRTCAVWEKDVFGVGDYFRQEHELLLVATRGTIPTPSAGDRAPSVIRSPNIEYSRKPNTVYDIIERMYPQLPKIELFTRQPRSGWSRWGSQT